MRCWPGSVPSRWVFSTVMSSSRSLRPSRPGVTMDAVRTTSRGSHIFPRSRPARTGGARAWPSRTLTAIVSHAADAAGTPGFSSSPMPRTGRPCGCTPGRDSSTQAELGLVPTASRTCISSATSRRSPPINRAAARVLCRDDDGRILLMHWRDPHRRAPGVGAAGRRHRAGRGPAAAARCANGRRRRVSTGSSSTRSRPQVGRDTYWNGGRLVADEWFFAGRIAAESPDLAPTSFTDRGAGAVLPGLGMVHRRRDG